MAESTKIEWTDSTFSPWTGCTRVSAGCDRCYAAALAKRSPSTFGSWDPGSPRKRTAPSTWRNPVLWNRKAEQAGRPHRVFCSSMADVFDNQAPEEWRRDLWDLVRSTPALTWQLLTKRPQNIARMLPADWGSGWPNVWLGVTAEDQEEANRRIPVLLRTQARTRFLSCEPLLGRVDLRALDLGGGITLDALTGAHAAEVVQEGGFAKAQEALRRLGALLPLPKLLPGVDWVIGGGESGSGARPTNPTWARSLRDQCEAAFVPFLWKQWGEWAPAPDPDSDSYEAHRARGARDFVLWPDLGASELVGKRRAGALLDGREHREFPRVA